MSQYAWCEDSKSGLEFWKAIFKVINLEIIAANGQNVSQMIFVDWMISGFRQMKR